MVFLDSSCLKPLGHNTTASRGSQQRGRNTHSPELKGPLAFGGSVRALQLARTTSGSFCHCLVWR